MAKRILVVDDSSTFRRFLAMSLSKGGYEVLEASCGEVALSILGSFPVDMVITDLTMAGMDGLALVREIRGRTKLSSIPVIFMSTEGQESVKKEGELAGADGWMVKPFGQEELLGTLGELLP